MSTTGIFTAARNFSLRTRATAPSGRVTEFTADDLADTEVGRIVQSALAPAQTVAA